MPQAPCGASFQAPDVAEVGRAWPAGACTDDLPTRWPAWRPHSESGAGWGDAGARCYIWAQSWDL